LTARRDTTMANAIRSLVNVLTDARDAVGQLRAADLELRQRHAALEAERPTLMNHRVVGAGQKWPAITGHRVRLAGASLLLQEPSEKKIAGKRSR
jgi:hypothetical protein